MSILKNLFSKKESKKDEAKGFLDIDAMLLKDNLGCESVYRHQTITIPRFTKENPVTLGFLIKELFPDCAGKIKSAINLSVEMFGNATQTSIISNAKEVEDLRPVEAALFINEEGEELPKKGHNNIYLVRFNEDAPLKEVLFHFRGAGGLYFKSVYMRVSVMIPPLGKQEDLHTGTPGADAPLSGVNCAAEQTSFLIVEDHADNRKLLAQYEETEKAVEKKIKEEAELTDIERAVYDGFSDFKPLPGYVGYGKWLSDQGRWFDAYRQFVRVWHVSHHVLNNNPGGDQGWFYSLAYDMGKCLDKLGRLDEAAYFFELAKEKEKDAEADLDSVYTRLGDIRVKEESSEALKQRKAEIRSATEGPYASSMLTIGDMLGELFGAVPGSLTCMAIRNDNEEGDTIVKEAKEVWNIPLSVIAKDRTTAIIMYSPVGYITGNDADQSKLCVNNTFVIRVHKAQTGQDDGLFRLNIMLPAFNLDSEKIYLRRENIPEGMSIILGTHEPPKVDGWFKEPSFGHCYDLAKSGRFLESVHEAKYIFNKLISRWEELNEKEADDFFEAAYQVGYGLMDFRLMEKAQYYLEIAAQRRYVKYMQEYLNCLNNSFDPRTMSVIDSFMKMEFEEDAPKEIHEWNCFLKRRKAYFLVEARKFDEAKPFLLDLICDPDPTNRDFAKGELDYIESRSK